jgi:hypothetical protein
LRRKGLTGGDGSSLELMIALTCRYGEPRHGRDCPRVPSIGVRRGVVVGVLATATIAALEIAGRVDDETGVAKTVTHGLCHHAHISLMVGTPVGANLDVGQGHLRNEPLRVDQSEPPL